MINIRWPDVKVFEGEFHGSLERVCEDVELGPATEAEREEVVHDGRIAQWRGPGRLVLRRPVQDGLLVADGYEVLSLLISFRIAILKNQQQQQQQSINQQRTLRPASRRAEREGEGGLKSGTAFTNNVRRNLIRITNEC